MPETLIIALAFLFLVAIVILLVTLPGRLRQTEPLLRLEAQLGSVKESLDRVERTLREELARAREEAATGDRHSREELSSGLASFGDQLSRLLQTLTQTSEEKLERMRATVEERLRALQDENSLRLEKMRETVDEKLHATLEQRLGDAFQRVSERLEQVREGLGEMKSLASGVGDLKKVLTNIRTRGTFGEVQLGNLLDQVLTGEQYAQNVATRAGSNERVEFAIRLPGKDDQGSAVWLPIDAKFPQEDFQRLLEAQEQANPAALEEASRMLEVRIKNEARSIRDKYLDPPHTTDFGIMFLPTEGLFAEVIRRPGLFDQLQREFHVVVTGPTTLLAVLNSLQMGFRTLAIERRTSEVWSLLGAVKTEFGRFGEVLDKTQKKLQEASNTIETAATRSRAIERKLKNVQELPQEQAVRLLGPEEPDGDET
jgi:DNA recombination protein RmuC